MQQERQLMGQLEATPTAKVSSFAAFMTHVAYRVSHLGRALEVFGRRSSGSYAGEHTEHASKHMHTCAMPSPTVTAAW